MPQAKPVAKFRVGSVTASVWDNNGATHSVSLQKSYKKDGGWETTDVLFDADVLCAIEVLQRAKDFLAKPNGRVTQNFDV